MDHVCAVPGCPRPQPCPVHARTWNAGVNGWAWSRLRSQVLARDRWRCVCGEPATTVHHVVPLSAGGTDDAANLRAVCQACHHDAHGWRS